MDHEHYLRQILTDETARLSGEQFAAIRWAIAEIDRLMAELSLVTSWKNYGMILNKKKGLVG